MTAVHRLQSSGRSLARKMHADERLRSIRRHVLRRADARRSPLAAAAVVIDPAQAPGVIRSSGRTPLFAGTTQRFATCTGAAWTRSDRFLALYMLSGALNVYEFDGSTDTPRLSLRTTLQPVGGSGDPTNLAVSADGKWLAIVCSSPGSVALLRIDETTGDPIPEVVARFYPPGAVNMHGAAFSPDSRFLLVSCIDRPGGLLTLRLDHDDAGAVQLVHHFRQDNTHTPLVPKGASFAPDAPLVAISYGGNATRLPARSAPGFVELRVFDAEQGLIGDLVARSPANWNLMCGEDIAYLPDGAHIVITDHFADQALIVETAHAHGTLHATPRRIGWAAAGLRSPHGCATSPDGRWVAVANYGDAAVRVFDAHRLAG